MLDVILIALKQKEVKVPHVCTINYNVLSIQLYFKSRHWLSLPVYKRH